MSLLSVVDQEIKSCKAEQARMNDQIQFYRKMLQIMRSQPKAASVDSNSPLADGAGAAPAQEISPGEREDLELLERALEKAFCVRTGTGQPTKKPNNQSAILKDPRTSAVPPKEGRQTSAAPSGKQTNRMTSKSGRLNRKEQKNTAKPGSHVLQQPQTTGRCSKEKIVKSSMMMGNNDLSKNENLPRCTSDRTASHMTETAAYDSPQENSGREDSDQVAQWKSLRRKTNRLWDKVAALPGNPVPGRSHFMERMRASFPKDWPRGSPEQTRALLNRLTHQGRDLAQSYQTEELLDKQTAEAAAEPGCKSQEKLQIKTAELQKRVSQFKQEWDAWDRWRPEGGCLCPTGPGGLWGDGRIAPLPPTITYTTEAEIREMETLRIKVALLQQDIFLEQALSNILLPQLSSVVAGRGCPDISVLRDVYSLLGEGGQRYPAIVLDSEA